MNFYKSISFFALSVIFSFSFSIPQSAQDKPFELSSGKEAAIIGVGSAIGITALIVVLNNDNLTEDGINSLTPEAVNKLDRIAIGPYQVDVLGDVLL